MTTRQLDGLTATIDMEATRSLLGEHPGRTRTVKVEGKLMRSNVTEALAAFVSGVDSAAIPSRARIEVQRSALDYIGCAVRGSLEESVQIALRFAQVHHRGTTGTVIGSTERLSTMGATLVNGVGGHALDFDDIGLDVGHPTAGILPAALAAAEYANAGGAALIDGMVVGYEVASRFGRMFPKLTGPYERGYHGTSIYGVFGAAAATARILGLDEEQIRSALGMAASQSAGLRVNFGTMTKPFHAAQSNVAGLTSVLMAAEGFTASNTAIEGACGWIDTIGGPGADPERILDGLGTTFAVADGLWLKPYPCCGGNHFPIDATLALMRKTALTAEDVATIDVTVNRKLIEEVLLYDWPTTGLEGKFCLAYNIAAAVTDGQVNNDTFETSRIAAYEPVRGRITLRPSAEIDLQAAHVAIRTRAGDRHETLHTVLHGTTADPLSGDEVAEKFRDNCRGIIAAESITRIVAEIESLDDMVSVRSLLKLTSA